MIAFVVVSLHVIVTWLLFGRFNTNRNESHLCDQYAEQCVFSVASVFASAWYFFSFYSSLLFGVLEYAEACDHWDRVCELVKPFSPGSHKVMTVVRGGCFRKDVWRCPKRCSLGFTLNKLFSGSLEARFAPRAACRGPMRCRISRASVSARSLRAGFFASCFRKCPRISVQRCRLVR